MSIERTINELADRDAPLRSAPLTSLTGLSGDERLELASLWPTLPVERRRQVVERLTSLAEDNVELDFDAVYFEALGDPDAAVRIGAIRGLWEHTDRDVIPPLVALLHDDPNPIVRAEAALALGRFVLMGEFDEARPHDVETVTTALRRTIGDTAEVVDVRARAVEAVGASSQPWARDIIEDAYNSADQRLVASAIHAMGRSADPYWLPTLITELENPEAEIRYEAVAACGMIEDEDAVPDLIALLDDEDTEVREQTVAALGAIGGPDAVEALRERLATADDEHTRERLQAALDEAEFGDDPMGIDP
jgi:HEAT repeat protein